MTAAADERRYTPTEAKYKGRAKEMYVTYDLPQRTRGEGESLYPKVKHVDIAGDVGTQGRRAAPGNPGRTTRRRSSARLPFAPPASWLSPCLIHKRAGTVRFAVGPASAGRLRPCVRLKPDLRQGDSLIAFVSQ